VLFGGALRDLVAGALPVVPRDLDVVVAGPSVEAPEETFADELRRKTRFGGLHLLVEGVPFDVWPLEQAWAFQSRPATRPPTFADLPGTTFLNAEAAAVELTGPRAGTVYDGRLFEAVLSRTLEINHEPNPAPVQCVLRSLGTAARFQLRIGPKLARYLAACGTRLRSDELAEAMRAHSGHLHGDAHLLQGWLQAVGEWAAAEGGTPTDPPPAGELRLGSRRA
jgi:hypothetical protein